MIDESRIVWTEEDSKQDYRLRSKYGFTLMEYRIMHGEQNGRCAICEEECSSGRNLSVDHDHQTGAIRGLLCLRCNMGIGFFRDAPNLLSKAILYLDRAADMTWRAAGYKRTWWVDSCGKLVIDRRPIISEFDDDEVDVDPLEILTDKQRFVVELRYGLKDGYVYEQREIAKLMGVSHSMVNQHEKAAIKKLKKYLRTPPALDGNG